LTIPHQIQEDQQMVSIPNIQVLLSSEQSPTPMRQMSAHDVNRLVMVPGIITAATRTQANATMVVVMCPSCKHRIKLPTPDLYTAPNVPARCTNESCEGTGGTELVPLPDENTYIDTQRLKMQESPEAVPTGEMPRSMFLQVTGHLVDQVSPGTRVKVIGISSVFKSKAKGKDKKNPINTGVRESYLYVVGLEIMDAEKGRASTIFTPEEEQKFQELARMPDIYQRISESVSPAISGDYTHDIKKAIACLLFSGTRRILPDGMKLRGDINVLLLGDPSTAKSQFLKFVEKVAPIGVYTSGKGSSAAGLTANVIKDARGEFFLEGGAMVLADGGVVCIDEFDKMREEDRVAIHEAMEQQTISIAKAGITTVLNSRSSVLAAANPINGTFDELKSMNDNLTMPTTILSRFDLIFIVLDVKDRNKDLSIARHVIGVHIDASTSCGDDSISRSNEDSADIDLLTMKKYIQYCRHKCAPVLSANAAEMLRNHYVGIREDHRKRAKESQSASIPITVRQLQAVVRIAEALAKMELSFEATAKHVAEAIRLFKVSTLRAANTGALPTTMYNLSNEDIKDLNTIESQIRAALPIGGTISKSKLVDDLVNLKRFRHTMVDRTIKCMMEKGDVEHISQQKLIYRAK